MLDLGRTERQNRELRNGYIIMIGCLMVISGAVVYTAMERLQDILIPFLLAVALSYLLAPLVDLLSCRGAEHSIKLPRILAVITSFCVGVGLIVAVGLVLLKALSTFQERSASYTGRVEQLVAAVFDALSKLQQATGAKKEPSNHTVAEEAEAMVESFLADMSVTQMIMDLLGTAAHILEDVMYIVLFLVFMLAHSAHGPRDKIKQRVERQIFIYIRGKSSISAFVGSMHALVLFCVGLQGLWLPFGVLTFFLNFIPNVGGLGAVLLPMPLIALDPAFNSVKSTVAFVIPFGVNIFAKDVLEPKILGHATDLSPVAILLAILIYGSVWGITGMVLAIPLTAVLRIYLEHMHHPVPKMLARLLSGREAESFGLHWEAIPKDSIAPHFVKVDYPKLLEAIQEVAARDCISFTQEDFDSFEVDDELTEDNYVTVDVPTAGPFPKKEPKHFRPFLEHSAPPTTPNPKKRAPPRSWPPPADSPRLV